MWHLDLKRLKEAIEWELSRSAAMKRYRGDIKSKTWPWAKETMFPTIGGSTAGCICCDVTLHHLPNIYIYYDMNIQVAHVRVCCHCEPWTASFCTVTVLPSHVLHMTARRRRSRVCLCVCARARACAHIVAGLMYFPMPALKVLGACSSLALVRAMLLCSFSSCCFWSSFSRSAAIWRWMDGERENNNNNMSVSQAGCGCWDDNAHFIGRVNVDTVTVQITQQSAGGTIKKSLFNRLWM